MKFHIKAQKGTKWEQPALQSTSLQLPSPPWALRARKPGDACSTISLSALPRIAALSTACSAPSPDIISIDHMDWVQAARSSTALFASVLRLLLLPTKAMGWVGT